ncbi:MAG: TIGR03032 family protein [Verrucomicrobiales bacterium]|nr:TIGR03032 family protein [Verrucomicrobiales bacterium]
MSLQEPANPAPNRPEPSLQVESSRHFADWMASHRVSLAFTSYQSGKLFFAGCKANGTLSLFERTYNRCLGLWASPDGRTLWLSSKYQLWRFHLTGPDAIAGAGPVSVEGDTAPPPAWREKGYDAVYLPRTGHTTGDLDIHDVAVDRDGRVIFVNTSFGCLATLAPEASFSPLWRPPFLTALVPEDRCHLNGLAMRDGMPAFVTVVSRSDVVDGWRARRHDGGCVLTVPDGEVVASGLSMPHSPRWHQDRLWVLNSGRGEFGWIDLDRGSFEPVAFCPGYLRGLSFVGDHAVITLSKPRDRTFHGLPLDQRLAEKDADPQCGLMAVNLRTGAIDHWLRLEGTVVTELYDVVALPNVRQPMALGFKTDEIERLITVGDAGALLP